MSEGVDFSGMVELDEPKDFWEPILQKSQRLTFELLRRINCVTHHIINGVTPVLPGV
jgi:hypothetical protein